VEIYVWGWADENKNAENKLRPNAIRPEMVMILLTGLLRLSPSRPVKATYNLWIFAFHPLGGYCSWFPTQEKTR